MASPPDGEKVTEPCGSDSPHAFFFGNGPLRSVFLLPLRGRTGSQCSRTRFGRFFTFNPNFKQMENIQTKQYPCFKRWSRKNWSVFASLHRYVTIGVLSVGMSILLLATQGASAQTADTTAVLKTLRIREVGVTGSQTAPARNAQSHTPLFDRKAQAPAPVQTLEAALRLAPSVDVRERGGKGTQADIFIRGGSFDQTMVLLNGIDFTDARTGHQSHALPVDLDCISAVELIDGVPGVGAYRGGEHPHRAAAAHLPAPRSLGRPVRLWLRESFGRGECGTLLGARRGFVPPQRRLPAQYRFLQLQRIRTGDLRRRAGRVLRLAGRVAGPRFRLQRFLCGLQSRPVGAYRHGPGVAAVAENRRPLFAGGRRELPQELRPLRLDARHGDEPPQHGQCRSEALGRLRLGGGRYHRGRRLCFQPYLQHQSR